MPQLKTLHVAAYARIPEPTMVNLHQVAYTRQEAAQRQMTKNRYTLVHRFLFGYTSTPQEAAECCKKRGDEDEMGTKSKQASKQASLAPRRRIGTKIQIQDALCSSNLRTVLRRHWVPIAVWASRENGSRN